MHIIAKEIGNSLKDECYMTTIVQLSLEDYIPLAS